MSVPGPASTPAGEGAAFPWILEHLLTYPAAYEIPLRTMYRLNSTSQNPTQSPVPPSHLPGNAFPLAAPPTPTEDQQIRSTAAAQLRANLMSYVAQLPSQPSSLPPSFVTGFVRRCFPPELDQVDFPQSLTALDYLKDLEVRRRREVVAALERLGVDRGDLGQKEMLGKKYPGVLRWIVGMEDKERKVEALYTQVYIGLRRWVMLGPFSMTGPGADGTTQTLINELSLVPFNKSNCIAMLNTLYPPTGLQTAHFVQPTAQLTPTILSTQRNGFFRYITAVEKNGTAVLASLMDQHKRADDETGWTVLQETVDRYLRMANAVIDECHEVGGRDGSGARSPAVASFGSTADDDGPRRKFGSGTSFTSSNDSSNRNSGQSHHTRPSTSSSVSLHSRATSKDKPLPDRPALDDAGPSKPAGSTLERIARELRKMKSRGDLKDANRSRPSTTVAARSPDVDMADAAPPPTPPGRDRKLLPKMSLRRMRSNSALRERDINTPPSVPASRDGPAGEVPVPAFDVDEMRRRRMLWEAQQKKKPHGKQNSAERAILVE